MEHPFCLAKASFDSWSNRGSSKSSGATWLEDRDTGDLIILVDHTKTKVTLEIQITSGLPRELALQNSFDVMYISVLSKSLMSHRLFCRTQEILINSFYCIILSDCFLVCTCRNCKITTYTPLSFFTSCLSILRRSSKTARIKLRFQEHAIYIPVKLPLESEEVKLHWSWENNFI